MLTIHEAAAAMRRGDLTPADLLEQCLARIDLYEPAVRAWVVVDRDGAREQAGRLTAELARGEDRGPLHGIPVGVKDVIDVFDLPTGCGSRLWAQSVARQDAACVKRLRQAGAVILGKTVTTAYAYLDPPVTRNPWDLERTPGGSSSGSAAAVACGMCLAALGTQTVGSLTRPASYCGVCSFKPAYGRVEVDGVLPLAPTLDHVGVIARCVADLAAVGDILSWQRHSFDTRTHEPKGGRGWPRQFFAQPEDCRAAAEPEMVEMFAELTAGDRPGVKFQRPALPPELSDAPPRLRTILAVEAARVHADRLRRHPDDYPPRIRGLIEEGLRHTAVDYAEAEFLQARATTAAQHFFLTREVLLTPATTGAAPGAATTGDAVFNAPWSYCGAPTVSLPARRSADGLPLAVQWVGGRDKEPTLFAAAAWLEREVAFDMRLPPVPA